MGFHVPPLISIFHIHLHGFILPFSNRLLGKYKYNYGPVFKSVEEVMTMLSKPRLWIRIIDLIDLWRYDLQPSIFMEGFLSP